MLRSVCMECGYEIFHDKLSGTTTKGKFVPNHQSMPNVSHGLCQDCYDKLMAPAADTQPATSAYGVRHEGFEKWILRTKV